MGRFQFVDVVTHVAAKTVAMEVHPLVPIGFARLAGSGLGAGLLAEFADGRLAVVGRGSPAIAVDPDAVHAILASQFAELRDHQRVDVRPEHGGRPVVGLTVRH